MFVVILLLWYLLGQKKCTSAHSREAKRKTENLFIHVRTEWARVFARITCGLILEIQRHWTYSNVLDKDIYEIFIISLIPNAQTWTNKKTSETYRTPHTEPPPHRTFVSLTAIDKLFRRINVLTRKFIRLLMHTGIAFISFGMWLKYKLEDKSFIRRSDQTKPNKMKAVDTVNGADGQVWDTVSGKQEKLQ